LNFFLEQEVLLSPDIFADIKEEELQKYKDLIEKIKTKDFLVFNKDIISLLDKFSSEEISWLDLEKSKTLSEKGTDKQPYKKFIDYLSNKKEKEQTKTENDVKVLFSYKEDSQKRDIQDFVSFFNARYKSIESILRNRQELQNITTINRIINKRERENISLIGIVSDKHTTKNGNIMLTVEDPTGSIKVLINKNKPELLTLADEIVLDEVIGIVGANGDNIIFANNVLWPDIPLNRKLKKHDKDVYAIFLSDLHVGSKNFLLEDFNKFLSWLNCETGNDQQKEIASKVKYLFIAGDIVDGCGVYPDQDKELITKDIYRQYQECAELLKKIPKHINLIICPGNHDALRIAEPQPQFYKDFSAPLFELPNTTLVSNPALINICSSENFTGFDVLMYHGYSFDHFVANVSALRNKGGYDRADLIMKFLLKRRHLAPTYTSTPYLPEPLQDYLVIKQIPDFFITGHLHKSIAANYRNVTMICGSCWQSKTSFQERVGHNPEPSRVPIVNLKTREVKILRFGG